MRRLLILCGFLLVAPAATRALEPSVLTGTWVGTHDDQSVVWQVMDGERLRVDGRPGDFEIHGDTLLVRFDPPIQADPDPGVRELAIYHFVASTPANGQARLFLSGFDLGKQGAILMREPAPQSEEGGTEDAAPPTPPRSCRPISQRTASIPAPTGDRSQH